MSRYNAYNARQEGKQYIQWTKKFVDKVKLNQYLSKHLLKFSVQGNIALDLSDGAKEVIRKRKNELMPNTLRLIVMSGQEQLLELVMDRLNIQLIEEYIKADLPLKNLLQFCPAVDNRTKKPAEQDPEMRIKYEHIAKFVNENPERLTDQDKDLVDRLLVLGHLKGFESSYPVVAKRVMDDDDVEFDVMYNAIQAFPDLAAKALDSYYSSNPVKRAVNAQKLLLVKNPNPPQPKKDDDEDEDE